MASFGTLVASLGNRGALTNARWEVEQRWADDFTTERFRRRLADDAGPLEALGRLGAPFDRPGT